MALLKKMSPFKIQIIFMKYDGVMKVMCVLEDDAQKMEKEVELS